MHRGSIGWKGPRSATNFIKIDVDGIEDKVLGGMRSTLASEKLRGVLCEISGTEAKVEATSQDI